jgi:2-polyprenyl-3-methyl-5-hydroxy-6-metoxy-1,4-benzoquinol methylase
MINEHPEYQPCANALVAAYNAKQKDYFAGARLDYIAELPKNPNACILEIGCGNGNTGAIAISEGKCARYCAVEIHTPAVEIAKTKITEVVQGNVETMDMPWTSQSFDALILSEVLEHLVDPWAVLRKLRPLMKPGALVFASTPNISHYKVVLMLLRGQFRLTDKGVTDRTHLRWFTPQTFREMFKSCGYCVYQVRSLSPLSLKEKIASFILGKRHEHLFWGQIDLRASS